MSKEIGTEKELADYLFHLEGRPIEQALAIQDLINKGWTQQKVGKAVGWNQGQISRRLKLLNLTPKLKKRVLKGEISARAAYYLAMLTPEQQKQYEQKRRILLKDVEAERRGIVLSQEVMTILEQPILPASSIGTKIECPQCGKQLFLACMKNKHIMEEAGEGVRTG